MSRRITLLLLIAALFPISAVFAQDVEIESEETAFFTSDFNFFTALFTGLIIALAIQLLLTGLSVATGITFFKPEEKIAPSGKEQQSSEKSSSATSVVTMSNSFGLWAFITAVLAVFTASWMGVELSGLDAAWPAVIMGLVIWGTFYIVMTALETTIATTMIGSLYNAATAGLRTAGRSFGAMFGKSPSRQAADAAEKVTKSVRKEVFGDINTKRIRKELQKYVQQLRPPSAEEIRTQIEDMLDDMELEMMATGDPVLDVEKITAKLETEKGMSKENARAAGNKLKDAIDKIRNEYKSEKPRSEAGIDAAMEAAGMDKDQAEQTRARLEEYLRNTKREELEPEGIKRDIERLLTEPAAGAAALKSRLSSINKDTVTAVLEQRKDIDHEKAESIADHIQAVFFGVKSKAESTTESAKETAGQQKAQASPQQIKDRVEKKMSDYINSIGDPNLQYEEIKDDFMLMMHNPRAGADELLEDLDSMDRDTLKAVVAKVRGIPPEQAEKIVEKMEQARNEMISKANKMKFAIEEKVTGAQQKAADITGQARKATAAAAWWSVIAAIGSAGAAVGGGILAVVT